MNIEKHTLGELTRCYAVSHQYIDGTRNIFFASEGEDACYMYKGDNFEKSTVWEKPGGTMSIVFLPNSERDFLAVQNFLPTFQAENSTIVWGHYNNNNEWEIKEYLKLPYVHRFDILTSNGINYFIGATLCTSKKEKTDWSDPGKIYVGILGNDLGSNIELKIIKEGLTKNHGYSKVIWNRKESGMVTCEEGVFVVTPPENINSDWTIEKILDKPVSDVAVVDIDGDGEVELATIEAFHGGKFIINKKINGKYEEVYSYKQDREFGHVVWGGKLRGKPVFIGGFRRPVPDFFYIEYDKTNSEFKTVTINPECGPSNIDVINEKDKDIIAVANRESGLAELYFVTD